MTKAVQNNLSGTHTFSGNIFIFEAFDVGDEINLEGIEALENILTKPLTLAKYFKNYHIPLSVDLPQSQSSPHHISTKIHNFGVISLVYKIPFQDTLENLKKELEQIDLQIQEQSVSDVGAIFKQIKPFITQPRLFHLRTSYVVIQVDQQPDTLNVNELQEHYSGTIASLVRFEVETLSELQKNEIMEDAGGYYRGDLVVIDTEAAFLYDDDYAEILDLFEFANIQQLELQYFDRKLGEQLYSVYQKGVRTLPVKAYLPFIGTLIKSPIGELDLLKVDISMIIERLASSIKIASETYVSEIYALLVKKLDLENWRTSIDSKLEIIKDMHTLYQHKVDAIREDSLSLLIIILIFIEVMVAIMK